MGSCLTFLLYVTELTETEMVSQALLVLLAGYETTANTLAFIGHCLATNPKCQDKLIEEIREHIGNKVHMHAYTGIIITDNILNNKKKNYP